MLRPSSSDSQVPDSGEYHCKNNQISSFSHRSNHGGSVDAWPSWEAKEGQWEKSFESSNPHSFFRGEGKGEVAWKRGEEPVPKASERCPAAGTAEKPPPLLLSPNPGCFPSVTVAFAVWLDAEALGAVFVAVAFLVSVCSSPSLSGQKIKRGAV